MRRSEDGWLFGEPSGGRLRVNGKRASSSDGAPSTYQKYEDGDSSMLNALLDAFGRRSGRDEALALLRRHVDFTVEYAGASLEPTVAGAIEVVSKWLGADYACLHFASRDEVDDIVHEAGLTRCGGPLIGVEVERAVIERAVASNQPLLSLRHVGPFENLRTFALAYGGKTFAVVNAYYRGARPEPSTAVLEALDQLGHFIYAGVSRRIVERDGNTYSLMVGLMASLLEQKDEYTAGHCDRVLHYAERLAVAAGIEGDELRVVRRTALLHDIGKVGVPESILNFPGPLDDEQRKIIREHAALGERLLSQMPGAHMRAVAQAVGAHHEWFDGSGYPNGLAGEHIPRSARVVGICDAYDVMTAGRVYREAWTSERAVEELVAGSARQFDPHLVQTFTFARAFEQDEATLRQHVHAL
jgi:HD-GYP domain-containing protein (c-di-GMP phosphodiesterase class II)